MAKQIAKLAEAMRLAQVDVVGHGWGGLVARSLALRNPRLVRALVTVDTPLDRLDKAFQKRWEEGRSDPEVLRRRLLRELPPGISGEQRSALGLAIQRARRRAIERAYGTLAVRRRVHDGESDWTLRAPALPEQPWLAIRSESIGAREVPTDGPRLPRTEWWSQPLADPPRFWKSLAALARPR